MKYILTILLALVFVGSTTLAKGNKYFITVPHEPSECMKAIDDFQNKSALLDKTEWGCMSGDHTSYVFVNAKNENDAKMMLPEELRDKAKIVKVDKFTAKQIADLHKKMDK